MRAQNTNIKQAMALFATVLFLLLFSRAVFAFPILFAHNRWSKDPLTLCEVVVAWRVPIKTINAHDQCLAHGHSTINGDGEQRLV